jgi:hypothetical protein
MEGELQKNLRCRFHSPGKCHSLLCGEPVSSAMPLQPCKQIVPEPHVTTYYHTSQQGWVRSLLFPSLQCQKQILQRQHKIRYLYRCGFTF